MGRMGTIVDREELLCDLATLTPWDNNNILKNTINSNCFVAIIEVYVGYVRYSICSIPASQICKLSLRATIIGP